MSYPGILAKALRLEVGFADTQERLDELAEIVSEYDVELVLKRPDRPDIALISARRWEHYAALLEELSKAEPHATSSPIAEGRRLREPRVRRRYSPRSFARNLLRLAPNSIDAMVSAVQRSVVLKPMVVRTLRAELIATLEELSGRHRPGARRRREIRRYARDFQGQAR